MLCHWYTTTTTTTTAVGRGPSSSTTSSSSKSSAPATVTTVAASTSTTTTSTTTTATTRAITTRRTLFATKRLLQFTSPKSNNNNNDSNNLQQLSRSYLKQQQHPHPHLLSKSFLYPSLYSCHSISPSSSTIIPLYNFVYTTTMRQYHHQKQDHNNHNNKNNTTKAVTPKTLLKKPQQKGSLLFLLTTAVFVTTPLFAYYTLFGNNNSNNKQQQHGVVAEAADMAILSEDELSKEEIKQEECPVYGCSLLPKDIYYDRQVRFYLSLLRESTAFKHDDDDATNNNKEQQQQETNNEEKKSEDEQASKEENEVEKRTEALSALQSSGRGDAATLTLVGYKGGPIENQINQDRAFVISPYNFNNDSNNNKHDDDDDDSSRLLGVFDGHAKLGEGVSQHAVSQLPKVLSSKLQQNDDDDDDDDDDTIKQALHETFLQLDKTAPAQISGGCTASVIFQKNSNKVYIANAGDSQSFVASYIKPTKQVTIEYITREDKPSLPEEKQRVESMGGRVYVPPSNTGGTSRVMYLDEGGNQFGLAMSRSIGDWDAGKIGVIPDPIVDVLSIEDIVKSRVDSSGTDNSCVDDGPQKTEDAVVGEDGSVSIESSSSSSSCVSSKVTEADIEIFAVSATDGLLDYVSLEAIASHVAKGLFEEHNKTESENDNNNNNNNSNNKDEETSKLHLLNACEDLIMAAAKGWHEHKNGRYRDDIAIAVSVLPRKKKA